MRILHILDHSLPLQSGYAFRTVSILREQRALGWETLHLTTPRQQANAAVEEADGWQFHRTGLAPSRLDRFPGAIYVREMHATGARLAALIAQYRPDILHAHSPVLDAMPALRVGRRFGIPVVYELRALWEDAAVDHGSTTEGSARYRISRALETFALRRADHVTTICAGLRDEIVARGIDAAKVTVIPNAVDATTFRFGVAPDEALRRELGLGDALVLGFAGSFYAYEGIDLLLEAVATLRREGSNVRALLVGGGPQEAALREQVAGLGIADRVVFTGRVPHGQVQRYYELIDVLVYARHRMRLTELVTPLKPLEAMAQGRILVASDVGGHRELIDDGRTGFLFPAGDGAALAARLREVIAARPAWPTIATQGRAFVERERTWTRSVARYAPVYASLASRRRGDALAAPAN